MNGFQGQYAFIVPSHDLVVVRLGATNGAGTGSFDLVLDVIAAMKSRAAAFESDGLDSVRASTG